MTDKKAAFCIYCVMRAFGIPKGKALRALFILRDVTLREITHRSDLSAQFVRLYLEGRRKSKGLDRYLGEMLFGDRAAIDP